MILNRSEIQEELLLQDRKTILWPAPKKRQPDPDEEREHESPFKAVRRIMEEGRDE